MKHSAVHSAVQSAVIVRWATLVAFALTFASCVGAPEHCRGCLTALADGGELVPDVASGTGGAGTGGDVATGGATGSGGMGTGGANTGGAAGMTGTGGRGTGGAATGGAATGGAATGGMATGGAASGGMGTGGRGTGGANTGGANTGGMGGAPIDPALVLWYKFDETSGMTAADSSGNARNGTLTNVGGGTAAFSSMDKVPPGSCQLTSSSPTVGGYVNVPTSLNQMGAGTAVTVALWVYVRTARDWVRIFDFGNSSTTGYFFMTPQTPSVSPASMRVAITTAGTAGEQIIDRTTKAAFGTGAWHHVAVTLGTGTTYTGTLYYDKVAVGSNAAMTIRPSVLGNTTRNWIGRSGFDTNDPLFDGYIDDFRIYSRALTAAEIAALP